MKKLTEIQKKELRNKANVLMSIVEHDKKCDGRVNGAEMVTTSCRGTVICSKCGCGVQGSCIGAGFIHER